MTPLTSLVVLKRDGQADNGTSLPSAKGYQKLAKDLIGQRVTIKVSDGDPEPTARRKCGVPTSSPTYSSLAIDNINWLSEDEDQIEMPNGIETFRVARENQTVSLLTLLCFQRGGYIFELMLF